MQGLVVGQPILTDICSSQCLVPEHETTKHVILLAFTKDTTGGGDIYVTSRRSTFATRKTDVELGVGTGSIGQERLPLRVVEAGVAGAVSVEDLASVRLVVVELDPQTVELDVVEEIPHLIDFAERALGSASDDIGPTAYFDKGSQSVDHSLVALVTG